MSASLSRSPDVLLRRWWALTKRRRPVFYEGLEACFHQGPEACFHQGPEACFHQGPEACFHQGPEACFERGRPPGRRLSPAPQATMGRRPCACGRREASNSRSVVVPSRWLEPSSALPSPPSTKSRTLPKRAV